MSKGASQGFWNYPSTTTVLHIVRPIDGAVTRISTEWIELNAAVPLTVTVSGISDVPGTTNLKEARFSWTYPKLPSRLKRFAATGGEGIAVFRLYDDGWRVERTKLTPSSQGFTLSDAEKEDEQVDIRMEQERQRLDAEARVKIAAARKLEEERLAQMITEAKTPTKTLMRISYPEHFQPINNSASFIVPRAQSITLTDVDLRFIDRYGRSLMILLGRPMRLNAVSCNSMQNHIIQQMGYRNSRIFLMTSGNCNEEIQIPVQAPSQRDELIKKTNEAIQLWRARFGKLPSYAFR
ncbi:MAG: hypothetical protein ACRECO_12805 [Xanthobacteraceae bacterium]